MEATRKQGGLGAVPQESFSKTKPYTLAVTFRKLLVEAGNSLLNLLSLAIKPSSLGLKYN